MLRHAFRLFFTRKEIASDIINRMSPTMRDRWATMDDITADNLNDSIGFKIRSAYGLYDVRNRFVEIDNSPPECNQYHPEAISRWVIGQVRSECQRIDEDDRPYPTISDHTEGLRDAS